MEATKKLSNLAAVLLLASMFLIMLFSVAEDSAIMDELAHIPAGYSYVALKDMRLNPEHPPLIKDLAGLPLLLLDLNFPTDTRYWREDINGQWDQGRAFLYESGNDPDEILRYSRFPMMLLAVLFGWLLFKWVSSIYGNKIALMTLFLYAFSPTFIAHSRYVTTDLAAAFGFFIGIASFVKFLEKPTTKRLILAGIAFGIAELLKFSLFLLVPIYGVLAILWVFLGEKERSYELGRKEKIFSFLKETAKIISKLIIIGLIGAAIIWMVYIWHVWNYPPARQLSDTETILNSFGFRPAVNLDIWLTKINFLRPLGEYLLGLLMVVQRAAGGNTTYYFGEVSSSGWSSYFPVAYLLKETLALHLLALLAIILAIKNIINTKEKNLNAVFSWLKDNFALSASLFFIAFYWIYSIRSPLNIGVRHVLPTFPFIYLLVSRQVVRWLYRPKLEEPATIWDSVKNFYTRFLEPIPKAILVGVLMVSMAASVLLAFPYYLSYYNGLVGVDNGYKYIVDSNYDWGQDLIRLKNLTEENKIDKIYLEYFGGGSPGHYLGDKFEPWYSSKGSPPSGSYFAVSATLLQGAHGRPVRGFERKEEDSYLWLRGLEPAMRAGTSIFIYKIP